MRQNHGDLRSSSAESSSHAVATGCPVCAVEHVRHYCVKGGAHYYVCRKCSTLFQYPVPGPERMLDYADGEYRAGAYGEYVAAREMKLDHFRDRAEIMRAHVRKGRLLDVGCSCGYFLEVAAEEGYDIRGVEFSSSAIAAARPEIRNRIIHGSADVLASEQECSYDVISAFDIIEHLERPLDFLVQARRLLRPGGKLVVSTPDADHWLQPLMRSRWPMLQPMQHLTLFSRTSLSLAFEKAGLTTESVEPAYKTISYDYLINQVRALNPFIYSIAKVGSRALPASIMRRKRHINIGELLGIAGKGM